MCTSIVSNRNRTIVGWNLDLLDMDHRVTVTDSGVYIEVLDAKEGWMPLFGANARGDFVGMPTCWPYDPLSDPPSSGEGNHIIMLDTDLLLQKKTFEEVKEEAQSAPVFSVPGLTFMGALSDASGNVLHIVPGQGVRYYERPEYTVLTNFSPFGSSGTHPWMGRDRYEKAVEMLKDAPDDFDTEDCFRVLKAVSQEVCPTVVSMVFEPAAKTVRWCEDRRWDRVETKTFG